MSELCAKKCAASCDAMESFLRTELEMASRYREFSNQCEFPEVRLFLRSVLEAREQLCRTFSEKLAELDAERAVTGQIGRSFH